MKRLSAIVFSLLLVWTQAFAGFPARLETGEPARCTCRDCDDTCCCVTPSPPKPAPAPVAPVPVGNQSPHSLYAPAAVAWTLPTAEVQPHPPTAVSSLTATGVPLFTRHCAFLI